MAVYPRLRGGKTETWSITTNNQVGPDTSTLSIRTIPSYTGNVIFVGKIGDDGNAGTNEAAPKLTIQAAIDAAVTGSKDHVVIIDSGVYTESINVKEKYIVAKDGFAPTIKYNGAIGSSASTISANAISQLEYWPAKGVFLALDSTGDLFYSADTYTWTAIEEACSFFFIQGTYVYFGINTTGPTVHKVYHINTTSYTPVEAYDASAVVTDNIVGAWSNGYIASNGTTYDIWFEDEKIYSGYTSYRVGGGTIVAYTPGGDSRYIHPGSGTTLYRLLNAPDSISACGVSGGVLYVAGTGGIYTAGTQTVGDKACTRISTLSNIDAIVTGDDIVYASSNSTNDIYISSNGGASWSTHAASRDYVIAYSSTYGLVPGGADGKIYRFIDYVTTGNAAGYGGFISGLILDGDGKAQYICKPHFTNGAPDSAINVSYCTAKNAQIGALVFADAPWQIYKNVFQNIKQPIVFEYADDASIANNVFYNCDTCISGSDDPCNILHNAVSSCGVFIFGYSSQYIVKDNIIYNTGLPFDFNVDVYNSSDFDYNLFNQPATAARVENYSKTFTSNPLFVDEVGGDFRLRSIARGDSVNSLYIKGGTNQSSDSKDLGAWDFTRTLTTTTYADDYTFNPAPQKVTVSGNVPGYGSATNVNGVFSEWSSLESGEHIRRTFSLPFSEATVNSSLYKQIQDIMYLQSKVGNKYQFGYSTDGTNWVPLRASTGTVSGSTIAVTYSGEAWGKNKWSGYWIKIDSVYYRIISSTAKTATGTCTITVDGTPTTGSQAWSIDYILVEINKRSTVQYAPAIYQGEDDFIDGNPIVLNYTLELSEVDDES